MSTKYFFWFCSVDGTLLCPGAHFYIASPILLILQVRWGKRVKMSQYALSRLKRVTSVRQIVKD